MRQLAEWIVCALERRKATSVSGHKVDIYGFEAALYTLFSTAGLILIGSLLGRHIESLIIIAFFTPTRPSAAVSMLRRIGNAS